jgi:hypothetical protein
MWLLAPRDEVIVTSTRNCRNANRGSEFRLGFVCGSVNLLPGGVLKGTTYSRLSIIRGNGGENWRG